MSNVIALGDGAFGKCLVLQDEALINGISALIKETPQNSLVPFAIPEHNNKPAVCNLDESLHKNMTCWNTDLGLPTSRTVRNKLSHPVCGVCYSNMNGLRYPIMS